MIRSSSKAICETIVSIMGQHCAQSRYLKPDNFNKEIVLRVNLEPLHLLDNFIKEILALDTTKSYLRKQIKIGRIKTGDLNKLIALASFEKKSEEKSHFPASFWLSSSN